METPQKIITDTSEDDEANLMTNTGSLVVFVLDAGGALPISDATVSIYKSDKTDEKPIAVLKSGENGKTEIIYLATPPIPENTAKNKNNMPFELYDIIVDLEGYYQIVSRNIPVYPSVMSIQPVYMVPRPLDSITHAKILHDGGSETPAGGVSHA